MNTRTWTLYLGEVIHGSLQFPAILGESLADIRMFESEMQDIAITVQLITLSSHLGEKRLKLKSSSADNWAWCQLQYTQVYRVHKGTAHNDCSYLRRRMFHGNKIGMVLIVSIIDW